MESVDLTLLSVLLGFVSVGFFFVGSFVGLSSGSCKASPTAARLSVRFSIKLMSGVFAFTESTKLFTTFVAQLRSFATSCTASLITLVTPEKRPRC